MDAHSCLLLLTFEARLFLRYAVCGVCRSSVPGAANEGFEALGWLAGLFAVGGTGWLPLGGVDTVTGNSLYLAIGSGLGTCLPLEAASAEAVGRFRASLGNGCGGVLLLEDDGIWVCRLLSFGIGPGCKLTLGTAFLGGGR